MADGSLLDFHYARLDDMEHQLSLFPCLFASRVTVWWQAILGDFNDVMYQNGLVLQPRAPTIATNLFHVESRFLLTRDLHLTQGSRRELDYRAYLTRPDLVPKAVRFMLETGLLGQFQTLPTTYRVTTTDLGQPAA